MAKKPIQTQPAQSPHGLPISIEMGDGENRKVMFASVRKAPKLLAYLKAIADCETECDLAFAAFGLAGRRITRVEARSLTETELLSEHPPTTSDLEEVELQDASHQYTIAQARQEAAEIARGKAIFEFFLAGLMAAGYTEQAAEDLVIYFDPNRFHQLRMNVLQGCGLTDFLPQKEQ